jgi:7,8-dihydropterin-6-yl-methyl-4-(beta-D-ribofuranosyl)aminobenzene 5'-phosphate synthase
VNIKILFDNNTAEKDILSGWGFSCLVDNNVLFDTGEDGESLLHNMRAMEISVSQLEDVVISHDHWDHTGGLEEILAKKEGIKVYGCPGFSEEFKEKVKDLRGQLIELKGFVEIRKDMFATGAMQGTHKGQNIKEQALTVKTPKGITIVTGCAHPGIVKITEEVKERFPGEKLYCVVGGFHLKDKMEEDIVKVVARLQELGVKKIGPAHCAGEKAAAIFKKSFGENFIEIAAGKECEV